METERKSAIIPIITKIYRYRRECDVDDLVDALALFTDEDQEEQEHADHILFDDKTIQHFAAVVAEQTTSRINQSLERFGKFANITPASKGSGSESAPPPNTSAVADADGAGASFSSFQQKLEEALKDLTESQQEALLALIEGGDRLMQASNLILLEADELSEKSEDYQKLRRVNEVLTGILRDRKKKRQ